MAAPKNNSFWKNRSKHGRDILFATPEAMWEAATEYFTWCESHPLYNVEIHSGKRHRLPKMRPFTLKGLTFYLKCNVDYFRQFKKTVDKDKADFLNVIEDIESVIYTQKFEGAASGFFNANLISRELGLADKTEAEVINLTVDLTNEEIRRYSKILDEEY